jgi:hypothetical protein
MSSSQVFTIDDTPLLPDPIKYRQTVGALQYATLSRPDISFVATACVSLCTLPLKTIGQLLNGLCAIWKVPLILAYLFVTTLGPLLRLSRMLTVNWERSSLVVQAYSDSDWAGCPVDRRSTARFAVYLGSNLISWIARKQGRPINPSTRLLQTLLLS